MPAGRRRAGERVGKKRESIKRRGKGEKKPARQLSELLRSLAPPPQPFRPPTPFFLISPTPSLSLASSSPCNTEEATGEKEPHHRFFGGWERKGGSPRGVVRRGVCLACASRQKARRANTAVDFARVVVVESGVGLPTCHSTRRTLEGREGNETQPGRWAHSGSEAEPFVASPLLGVCGGPPFSDTCCTGPPPSPLSHQKTWRRCGGEETRLAR